jgi:hypothetical protein
MTKLPENLLLLKDYGDGVLQRIAYARRQVHSAPVKPILFTEEFTKVRAALVKKFPEADSSVEKVRMSVIPFRLFIHSFSVARLRNPLS